jgi:hypothetical protein
MRHDRYHPRTFDELAADPVPTTIINEAAPENVSALPVKRAHSLDAVLCDASTSNRGLLQRLEAGVHVGPGAQGEARAAVRDLYVQVRCTVQVLSRCLELPDLE